MGTKRTCILQEKATFMPSCFATLPTLSKQSSNLKDSPSNQLMGAGEKQTKPKGDPVTVLPSTLALSESGTITLSITKERA